ncbi:hypothetical protein SAMN05421820_11593 [Pedobacter steynii]|uniref:Uncharacterized protein n=1 Tax=Pedobacter steynii TaxID=430522 RepID=A0A1H0JW10_9SPHI|nr:tail fiber protein [Pedobacter steynii]NQX43178.1 hypothetical protein [Pedobacter steynii]SDO47794.1 hypothetical protein SAMN05421820_11593 [Pedobacter steynii]
MLKKITLLFLVLFALKSDAQNYNNILNYAISGYPTNGVKIKTNMPFAPGLHMPTININGYSYGAKGSINLTIVYYIYSNPADFNNPANYYFHEPYVSSSGGSTPVVNLSNEGGKVVIYINDKSYYQRFTVSAYSMGMSDSPTWFQGWTTADEPLTGTKTVEVPYKNSFKGDVYLSGNGIWNKEGNVGIGTNVPKERLSVNGNIRAREVKVESGNWPDYVFKKDYNVLSLNEIENHIQEKGHLPGIPSAKEVKEKGLDLGEMNAKLLEKIEELTLYLIKENKLNIENQRKLMEQEEKIQVLMKKIEKP